MLDDGHHLGGHEASGPHRDAGPRDLGHLDRPPDVRHFHPPTGTAGVDLEALHPGADVDENLDAVASHVPQATHTVQDRHVRSDASSPAWPWFGLLWPERDEALSELQVRLGAAAQTALASDPWLLSERPILFGGCFVLHRRGLVGPGRAGDRVWAAAVVWERQAGSPVGTRRAERHLRGAGGEAGGLPRQADDVAAQAVATATARAPYQSGFLAARDGAVLADALSALDPVPELVVVDASGLDHPRRAGLAVHLGAAVGLPTVGVTRRPLSASGPLPVLRRGARSPLLVDDRRVASWVCTKTGARPLVAHAGWRTSPETAVDVVLETSTPGARTPVPLQEARRVAREARSLAAGD